jgi:hypothetical protein
MRPSLAVLVGLKVLLGQALTPPPLLPSLPPGWQVYTSENGRPYVSTGLAGCRARPSMPVLWRRSWSKWIDLLEGPPSSTARPSAWS